MTGVIWAERPGDPAHVQTARSLAMVVQMCRQQLEKSGRVEPGAYDLADQLLLALIEQLPVEPRRRG